MVQVRQTLIVRSISWWRSRHDGVGFAKPTSTSESESDSGVDADPWKNACRDAGNDLDSDSDSTSSPMCPAS